MRRLEDQRQESTAAAIEKRGTADTMVGQKSGPALAGPAAPATTALRIGNNRSQSGFSYFVIKFKVLLICYKTCMCKQLTVQGYLRYAYEYYILHVSKHLLSKHLLLSKHRYHGNSVGLDSD